MYYSLLLKVINQREIKLILKKDIESHTNKKIAKKTARIVNKSTLAYES